MNIEAQIQQLRVARGWDQSDTPAILAKSIFVEAGELLECFQWDEHHYDQAALESEIADILMYTISLCMDLKLDYQQVISAKFADIEKRYPPIKR